MKKLFLLLFSSLLLVACAEEKSEANQTVQSNDSENIASVEDFSDVVFKNDEMQLIILKGNKVAIEAYFSHRKKTDIDTILEKESYNGEKPFAKNYENVEIKVDGSKYYVKLTDEFELEFEKIGERIIKDSQGNRYYAQNKH